MNRWTRAIAISLLLSFATAAAGCAYILHPERRGHMGGRVSGNMLLCDLLWLIPGILPGVVFLIVDFSSGAIYVHGGYALQISHDGDVAVQLPKSDQPTAYELRLVTTDHKVLESQTAFVGPVFDDGKDGKVALHLNDEVRRDVKNGAKVFLEVQANAATARSTTPIEVAR